MARSKMGEVENLIEFEVGTKPLVVKSNFPYGKIINGLKVLDSTKSLIFNGDKLGYNRMQTLRKLAKQEGMGYIKRCKKEGKVYIWVSETGDTK